MLLTQREQDAFCLSQSPSRRRPRGGDGGIITPIGRITQLADGIEIRVSPDARPALLAVSNRKDREISLSSDPPLKRSGPSR